MMRKMTVILSDSSLGRCGPYVWILDWISL